MVSTVCRRSRRYGGCSQDSVPRKGVFSPAIQHPASDVCLLDIRSLSGGSCLSLVASYSTLDNQLRGTSCRILLAESNTVACARRPSSYHVHSYRPFPTCALCLCHDRQHHMPVPLGQLWRGRGPLLLGHCLGRGHGAVLAEQQLRHQPGLHLPGHQQLVSPCVSACKSMPLCGDVVHPILFGLM